jgi:hypothetical protein
VTTGISSKRALDVDLAAAAVNGVLLPVAERRSPRRLLELTPDGAGLEVGVVQIDVIGSRIGGDGRSQLRADLAAALCVRASTIGVEVDDDRSRHPARGEVDVA